MKRFLEYAMGGMFLVSALIFSSNSVLADDVILINDTVYLEFTVEDWITSDTAEIQLSVSAQVDVSDDALQTEIEDQLNSLADTDWKYIGFSRSIDQSDLIRWKLAITARVSKSELANIVNSVKSASRPGLKFIVIHINYVPSKEELESKRGELRSKINVLIANEVDRMNREYDQSGWRVSLIQYQQPAYARNPRSLSVSSQPRQSERDQGPSRGVESNQSSGFPISKKMTLTAQVQIVITSVYSEFGVENWDEFVE